MGAGALHVDPLRRAPTAAAVALALAAAGCGGGDSIDTGKVESEVEAAIEDQTAVEVASVRCPDEVEIREGDSFRCIARSDEGNEATIVIRQIDDEGNVEFRAPSLSDLTEPPPRGGPVNEPDLGEPEGGKGEEEEDPDRGE